MKKIALALCMISFLTVAAGCSNPFASWFGGKGATEEVKPS